MKLNPFVAGVLCGLGAVAAGSALVRRAHADEPAARVQLISDLRDTAIYAVEYAQHTCFVASTKGGAGVSITCAR